jgi:hypothetical protein
MASEVCPVCCLILNVETPARVALVALISVRSKSLKRIYWRRPAALGTTALWYNAVVGQNGIM